MAKGLIRKVLARGILAVAIGGSMGAYGISNQSNFNSENPKGFDTCYLGENSGNVLPTTADVGCRRVILPNGDLVIPQKPVETQDSYCVKGMERRKDGVCEYFPPEYFDNQN